MSCLSTIALCLALGAGEGRGTAAVPSPVIASAEPLAVTPVGALDWGRAPRVEAFELVVPTADGALEQVGWWRRRVARTAPGAWQVQEETSWTGVDNWLHAVERLGPGATPKFVHRDVQPRGGRTTLLARNEPGAPLHLRITGERTTIDRRIEAARDVCSTTAIVEFLRRDWGLKQRPCFEPLSASVETWTFDSRWLLQAPCAAGLRLVAARAESGSAAGPEPKADQRPSSGSGQARGWWLFFGHELVASGGAAGGALALRVDPAALPEFRIGTPAE